MKQHTLQQSFSLTGVGLHSGQEATITVHPKDHGGIVFKRVDLNGQPIIEARPENFLKQDVSRCTVISKGEAKVSTIEHIMAAFAGLNIDHALVEINGEEMPGMDGSSQDFVEAIKGAGIKELDEDRRYFQVLKPVTIEYNNASISIVPADEFKVSYTLNYEHSLLSSQFVEYSVTPETFEQDIAPCRTFCLEQEAKALKEQGLGKGATPANTLIMGDNGPLDNELRFDNECARHKLLDCIGDLYLLGMPIKGHVYATRSGHHLNKLLVKALLKQLLQTCQTSKSVFSDGDVIDIHGIQKLLPHRYPFLLVDRVTIIEQGKQATGLKNVTANEEFFQGHFPIAPVMPGVLMIEAMAQVSGVLMLSKGDLNGKIALFMSVNNVKFRKPVVPGDQLVMDVEIVRDRGKTAQVHGIAKVNDQVAVEADMMFSYVDANALGGM